MGRTLIAILCHWGTGSSILARILNLCGMHTGNEKTGWLTDNKGQEDQCEHGGLNTVGNELYHGIREPSGHAEDILMSYKEQASENDWLFCGVKFTHVLQDRCWKYFRGLFNSIWPEADYVIAVRHPAGIIKSFRDVDITDKAIVESWMSTYDATVELNKRAGAIIILYPFTILKLKLVVKQLGLKWNSKVTKILRAGTAVTVAETKEFKKQYPEAAKMFEELSKLAI